MPILAELRLLESIRHPFDRRVLEAYPVLAELLRIRDESLQPWSIR